MPHGTSTMRLMNNFVCACVFVPVPSNRWSMHDQDHQQRIQCATCTTIQWKTFCVIWRVQVNTRLTIVWHHGTRTIKFQGLVNSILFQIGSLIIRSPFCACCFKHKSFDHWVFFLRFFFFLVLCNDSTPFIPIFCGWDENLNAWNMCGGNAVGGWIIPLFHFARSFARW